MTTAPSPARDKVALFDVCQTLVDVTTITDFADRFLVSRRNPEYSLADAFVHATYRFLRYRLRLVGASAYRTHLFSLYKGKSPAAVAALATAYSERLRSLLKRPVFDRLEELKRDGYRVYLVSAGINAYLKPFAASLGVGLIATTLEVDATGRYTGRIAGIDCLGEGKVGKVEAELPGFADVDWDASYSFGDSASDVPILARVGHAVAVDPAPELAAYARANEWEIMTNPALAASVVG